MVFQQFACSKKLDLQARQLSLLEYIQYRGLKTGLGLSHEQKVCYYSALRHFWRFSLPQTSVSMVFDDSDTFQWILFQNCIRRSRTSQLSDSVHIDQRENQELGGTRIPPKVLGDAMQRAEDRTPSLNPESPRINNPPYNRPYGQAPVYRSKRDSGTILDHEVPPVPPLLQRGEIFTSDHTLSLNQDHLDKATDCDQSGQSLEHSQPPILDNDQPAP